MRYKELSRDGSGDGDVREYRREGAALKNGSDAALEQPLPRWRGFVHRFRTFDPGHEQSCRH